MQYLLGWFGHSINQFHTQSGLTPRAADGWELAIYRHFSHASKESCSQTLSTPAHTLLTQTVEPNQKRDSAESLFILSPHFHLRFYPLARKLGTGGDEGFEQWMRTIGARLKFGMELTAHHERMIFHLGDLH